MINEIINKYSPESFENASDSFGKKYFQQVAKFMKMKLKSYDFDKSAEWRTIEFQNKDHIIKIDHSWKKDGSETKPVTYIEIDNYDDIKLGRFAIWANKPKDYAEDIINVINQRSEMSMDGEYI